MRFSEKNFLYAYAYIKFFVYICIPKKLLFNMNILLLGSGGREHAMACKIAASERCSRLFVAPGNAGTANLIKTKNINDLFPPYTTGIAMQIKIV